MNLNIIGYFIYLAITVFIILKVGKICYTNGNVYVAELIPNHKEICQKINQVLLLAYYLLNIGYCAMTLISWEKIISINQLIETIAIKTAIIIFIISILHYGNIIIITKYIQKLIK
ncbi:hypothetical protein C3L50_01900 [Flavobacterium alvei]|uniref:Uncharacterized protein n=1 Tax=Flavobacterium alvei TaxID=2080416 RepID=A0A2S5AFF9_9FLAO|nr:hypothetical protein [Flavobacterium alvei]POY41300.1 hypothetical protein C3L50_01900 [Flavobacterium alvei]HQE33313.1 hypothetical protein [Flavobacterium alvei]HQF47301.1 hypothetical protein [Flavobacterium alvei]HQK38842.1 hypothetical protein [Flavobacterium alvei]